MNTTDDLSEWQLCPKCNGGGYIANPFPVTTSITVICDVCAGGKILIKPKAQKVNIKTMITYRITVLQKEKERILNDYPSLKSETGKSISEVLNLIISMEVRFLNDLLNTIVAAKELSQPSIKQF